MLDLRQDILQQNRLNPKDDRVKDLLAAAYRSTKYAAKVFFPERFSRPFDKIHDDIFNVLDNPRSQKTVIAAPRGIGKTSINNFLIPAKKALFLDANYIVTVSASSSSAVLQSDNLKQKLVQSPLIRQLFGDIKTNNFSKDQWVIEVGGRKVCMMPRGAGQQVRGLLFEDARPDLIIVDDLENSDEVRSPEQRQKLKEWFFADLMNCVDRGSKDWRIIFLGTVLHEDSLLMNLLEDSTWDSTVLEICDDNFVSNAPNFMSDQEVRDLAESYRAQGLIDVFYREYRNKAMSSADAPFQRKYFKHYKESEIDSAVKNEWETIMLCDIARTANMASADSAIIVVGVNLRTNAIYVRDVIAYKMHPHEFYDEFCLAAQRYKVRHAGVEVTGLHEFITYPLKNEISRRGLVIEVVELHARGGDNEKGKTSRVRTLVPFYRQGLVYHNEGVCDKLEQQLLSFPSSKLWDVMDAFGYLSEMLDKGVRFMIPYKGEYEQLEDEEYDDDEFSELEYEDALEYERII